MGEKERGRGRERGREGKRERERKGSLEHHIGELIEKRNACFCLGDGMYLPVMISKSAIDDDRMSTHIRILMNPGRS